MLRPSWMRPRSGARSRSTGSKPAPRSATASASPPMPPPAIPTRKPPAMATTLLPFGGVAYPCEPVPRYRLAMPTDSRPQPRDDAYDAVVVGSGLGGVSTAALLAKHGYKTLVLEQGEGAGGLAHAFKRDDYTFDSAIRVLAEGEMVEGLLEYLGVLDECKLLHIDH